MIAVAVKWKDVQVHGFWFATNFLREEGLDDFDVKLVIDDLTEQYESYKTRVKHRDFGPDFQFSSTDKPHIVIITMIDPAHNTKIGETSVCFNDRGGISILPF